MAARNEAAVIRLSEKLTKFCSMSAAENAAQRPTAAPLRRMQREFRRRAAGDETGSSSITATP